MRSNAALAPFLAAVSMAPSCDGAVVATHDVDAALDGTPDRSVPVRDSGHHDAAEGAPPDSGRGICVADGGDANECDSGMTSCGGTCVNTQTDNSNCGGCGLVCTTGCSSGECIITVVGALSEMPWAVAVDSTSIYWTSPGKCLGDGGSSTGTIMSVPVTGGSPTTLATGQGRPIAIAVQGTNLYWLNENDCSAQGSVVTSALDGSGTTTLAANQGRPGHIAVDATNVYWTAAHSVLSVPLAGGSVTTLASGQAPANAGVAVEGAEVFWADASKPFRLNRVSSTGGTVFRLAGGCDKYRSDCASVGSMTADAVNLYWASLPAGSYFTYSIYSVPLGGGAVNELATNVSDAFNMTTDGKNVYWADYGTMSDGTGTGNDIVKVPVGGGTTATLAKGQSLPVGIAVDSTSVYWANSGSYTYGYSATAGIMKATPK